MYTVRKLNYLEEGLIFYDWYKKDHLLYQSVQQKSDQENKTEKKN